MSPNAEASHPNGGVPRYSNHRASGELVRTPMSTQRNQSGDRGDPAG